MWGQGQDSGGLSSISPCVGNHTRQPARVVWLRWSSSTNTAHHFNCLCPQSGYGGRAGAPLFTDKSPQAAAPSSISPSEGNCHAHQRGCGGTGGAALVLTWASREHLYSTAYCRRGPHPVLSIPVYFLDYCTKPIKAAKQCSCSFPDPK